MKYLTWLLGILAAIGAAFGYREKAKRLDEDNQRLQDSYDAEQRNSSALAESEKIYDERIDDVKKSPVNRDHFNRERRL